MHLGRIQIAWLPGQDLFQNWRRARKNDELHFLTSIWAHVNWTLIFAADGSEHLHSVGSRSQNLLLFFFLTFLGLANFVLHFPKFPRPVVVAFTASKLQVFGANLARALIVQHSLGPMAPWMKGRRDEGTKGRKDHADN